MHNSDRALKYLHGALDRVQLDPITPVKVSTEMLSFFTDLAARDVSRLTEQWGFLMALPLGALEDALLQQAIPLEHRDVIIKMREQHATLQVQLEDEILCQRFATAVAFRDQQNEIITRIRTILSGHQMHMTPSIVMNALQSLGWQQI